MVFPSVFADCWGDGKIGWCSVSEYFSFPKQSVLRGLNNFTMYISICIQLITIWNDRSTIPIWLTGIWWSWSQWPFVWNCNGQLKVIESKYIIQTPSIQIPFLFKTLNLWATAGLCFNPSLPSPVISSHNKPTSPNTVSHNAKRGSC